MELDRFVDLCIESEGKALPSVIHRDLEQIYDEVIFNSFPDLTDDQAVSIYRAYKIGQDRETALVRR